MPIDYSKFDNIGDSSGDEAENKPNNASSTAATTQQQAVPMGAAAAAAAAAPQGASMRKNEKSGRYVYEYNGQPIYEWEQTLDEVILHVPAPPVASSSDIHCKIMPRRLQLGVKQAIQEKGIYFIDEETFGLIDVTESTWTLEDGMLVIYLNKAAKGEVWDMALKGKQGVTLDPFAREQVQRDLMLERFQEENPGMDFRGAQFNGSVPDPRTFMGGVKYS